MVEFDHYKIKHKINQDLRSFFAIVQRLTIQKIEKEERYCTKSPVGFFNLLGIMEGDTIHFSDGEFTMNIYFTE